MKKSVCKFCVVLVGVALSCFASGALASSAKQEAGVVFDTATPAKRLSGKAPDYIYTELLRKSPDGKYVARLTGREGEVGYVEIYRLDTGARKLLRRGRIGRAFEDVHGCAWIPGHGHWLAISAGGADYGRGLLALWKGPKDTRMLRLAKSEDGEGYNIRSVSPDGRRLVYEHFGDNSPDPDYKRKSRIALILPRS